MYAQGIRLRAIGEAGDPGRNRSKQPRRRWWTGILYCRGEDGTLEGPLRFTIVVEAELVHRRVADGPGMADVPLLKSLVGNGAETGHIRARRLELREWGDQMVIIKIVIKAEVLLVIEAVVNPYGELVRTLRLRRCSHKFVAVVGWDWDKLEQVNGGGIQTAQRNDVTREEARI